MLHELVTAGPVRLAVVGADQAVEDIAGAYAAYFAQYGVEAVLYRPDFYVFGSARGPEELGTLRGRPRSAPPE